MIVCLWFTAIDIAIPLPGWFYFCSLPAAHCFCALLSIQHQWIKTIELLATPRPSSHHTPQRSLRWHPILPNSQSTPAQNTINCSLFLFNLIDLCIFVYRGENKNENIICIVYLLFRMFRWKSVQKTMNVMAASENERKKNIEKQKAL